MKGASPPPPPPAGAARPAGCVSGLNHQSGTGRLVVDQSKEGALGPEKGTPPSQAGGLRTSLGRPRRASEA